MKQSPHHYAKRFKTPTLVTHGEQDFRVPATQALQYYDTLHTKGVAARLMGTVPSVIFGGAMTLVVVALTAMFSPKLRRLRELH